MLTDVIKLEIKLTWLLLRKLKPDMCFTFCPGWLQIRPLFSSKPEN